MNQSLKNSTFHINMIGVVSSLCQSFWGYVFNLIGFVIRYLLRFAENEEKNHETDRRFFHGGREEEDKDCDDLDSTCSSSVSIGTKKYEVFTSKDLHGYVEKPKPESFTVHELFLGSDEDLAKISVTSPQVFDADEEEYWKNKFESFSKNRIDILEEEPIVETEKEEQESSFGYNNSEDFVALEKRESEDKSNFQDRSFDHDFENSVTQEKGEREESTSSQNSNFDRDFEDFMAQEKREREDTINPQNSSFDHDFEDFVLQENGEIEEKSNFRENSPDHNFKNSVAPEKEEVQTSINFEEEDIESIVYELFENVDTESEEGDYIEIEPKRESFTELREKEEKTEGTEEWDHDEVIEQLKLELRTARNGGLPTIMEEEEDEEVESRPPEDEATSFTKTKNMELKFGYKERMEEIQKVYKIYAERMRKLDIVNNQTMHALGLLQLKYQFRETTPKQDFVPIKPQKQSNPSSTTTLKHGSNLQNDFELVYVGQLCLSWEILRWQHRSVRDLLRDDDSQPGGRRRRYNVVAAEFQLFQVLIQRFMEDESFQGPRVQNYVKNRCVIRSLMQVPVVRDDCVKEKHYVTEENEGSVFIETLDKIIVETMFTFGEFVRKDEKKMNSKVSHQSLTEPGDTKLLMDIRRDFQKKERKLKEIQRSGNCLMRKLQKNQGQDRMLQHEMLLLGQVELRLVSRVLSMSRLTRDHLVWCQHKLNHITFSNKQLHLETSFLLIPC